MQAQPPKRAIYSVLVARLKMDTTIVDVEASAPEDVERDAIAEALQREDHDWLEHNIDETNAPFVVAVIAGPHTGGRTWSKPPRAMDVLHEALDAQRFVLLAGNERNGRAVIASVPEGLDAETLDQFARDWVKQLAAVREALPGRDDGAEE